MEKHHCMEMLPVCAPVRKEEKLLMLIKYDPRRKQDSLGSRDSLDSTNEDSQHHRAVCAKGAFGD